MINKMPLLWSSIPLFNTLSNYMTDLMHSHHDHFIYRTASDLLSEFVQRTDNTI